MANNNKLKKAKIRKKNTKSAFCIFCILKFVKLLINPQKLSLAHLSPTIGRTDAPARPQLCSELTSDLRKSQEGSLRRLDISYPQLAHVLCGDAVCVCVLSDIYDTLQPAYPRYIPVITTIIVIVYSSRSIGGDFSALYNAGVYVTDTPVISMRRRCEARDDNKHTTTTATTTTTTSTKSPENDDIMCTDETRRRTQLTFSLSV